MDKLKIFISGTQDDMKPEREAVDRAVQATMLATGIRAETAVSQPESPRAWIEQQLRECNLYLGVYSHRYGWVIPDENVSATEFEFNLARKLGKRILVWIRNWRESERRKPDFDRQKRFLNHVSDFSTGFLRQTFDNSTTLETMVATALSEMFTKIIREGTTLKINQFLVPFPRNPDFVGREQDLATLHTMLQQGNSPVGIRPIVLVGLGGIGKTQLAVEYAHAHRTDYPSGVFWLNAINPLLFEFAKLAETLELAKADTPRDVAAQACYEYLNQNSDTLVIFDNVEEPRNLNVPFAAGLIPANLQCRTLFTTRKRDFPSPFQPFEVKTLPEEAAMRLLLRHSARQPILAPNHPEHDLARKICLTLGCLPLALALASAFLAEYPNISLFDYHNRLLNEGAIEVVDTTQMRPEDMPTRHATAVRATLKTSWDALTDQEARLVLLAAGQLHEAELIPIARLGLLTGLAAEVEPGHPAPLTQALKKLYGASLIEELATDRLRLHPLVHAFAAQLAPPNFRAEIIARFAEVFNDLGGLQATVIQQGIDSVLDDLHTGIQLSIKDSHTLSRLIDLERVLSHEAHYLRGWNTDANDQGNFLLQQIRNCASELGYADLRKRAEICLADMKLDYLCERFPVNRASRMLVRTLEGHTSCVKSVAVTPDGQSVVSGSSNGHIKIWDFTTGKVLRTFAGHMNDIVSVAVTADGRWIVSASHDNTLKVWDFATGQCVRTLEGHTNRVTSVAVTSDSHWAVSVSWDHTLKVWDLTTGHCVRTIRAINDGSGLWSVAVTADGRWAVSESDDHTINIWDIATGQAISTFEGHTIRFIRVAVTSDSRWVISGSGDHSLRVWDLKTGQCVHTLEGHESGILCLAVTADSRWVVSSSYDDTIKVWNLTTGKEVFTLKAHTADAWGVAVTPDGRWVISASDDETLKVWDISSLHDTEKCLPSLTTDQSDNMPEKHTDKVTGVAVTADGSLAVSVSDDQTLKVWDVYTGQVIHTFEGGRDWLANGVALTADGRYAVSVSRDGIQVWNLLTKQKVHQLQGHTDTVNDVAVTADGRWVISASSDKTLKIWSVETGQLVRTIEGHTYMESVVVTTDGHWAISASYNEPIQVWDLTTGQLVRMFEKDYHPGGQIAATGDGRWVVDSDLQVWDITTGKVISTCVWWGISDLAVTADGRWVVSVSYNEKILRVSNRETEQAILSLTATPFQCCEITPDGKTIIAGDALGGVHFIEWVKFDS